MENAYQGLVRRDVSAAESAFRAAADAAASPLRQAIAWNGLGTAYGREGRFADAERCYLRAGALLEGGDDPRMSRRIAGNLSTLYLETGQFTRAEHFILRLAPGAGSELDNEGATLLSNLASVRIGQHRFADAEQLFRRVIDGLAGAKGAEGVHIRAVAMIDISECLVHAGRAADALVLAREALSALEATSNDGFPGDVTKATANVALLAARQGQAAEAEALFRKAIQEGETALGPQSYLVGAILGRYGLFLKQHQRGREGREAEERSARILAANQQQNSSGFTVEAASLIPSLK
jgi:Flp pilus assembly protein TadD